MDKSIRQNVIIGMLALSSILLIRNLYVMLLDFGDEMNQGAIWRIFYFHLPSAITSFIGFYIGAGLSIMYLWKKDLRYDAWAAVINEVSLVFATITLITGMIWARIAWGIWWAVGDNRLTSYLICILMYAGYLMLRRSVQDPAQRGNLSAVIAIFASLDIIIVWKSIEWWRGNHPGPVLSIRNGGGMAPGWESLAWWNVLAIVLLAIPMVLIRLKQEKMQGEIDSLRRFAHEQ
jgi:heme exporter protein C